MKAGEVITQEYIRRIRSGFGLAPSYIYDVISKTVKIRCLYWHSS